MSAYVSSDNLRNFEGFYEAYITGFNQATGQGRRAGMSLFLQTFRGTDIGNMLDGDYPINPSLLDSYITQAVREVVLPGRTSMHVSEFYQVVNQNSGAILHRLDQLITPQDRAKYYSSLNQFGGGYVKVPLKSFNAFMKAYDGKGNELRATYPFMETFGDTLMGRVINNEYRPEGLHEDEITEYFMQAVNEVVLPEGTRIQVEDFKQKVNTKKDAIIKRMNEIKDEDQFGGGKRRRRSKRASRKNRRKTKKNYTSKRRSKRKSNRRSKRRR